MIIEMFDDYGKCVGHLTLTDFSTPYFLPRNCAAIYVVADDEKALCEKENDYRK